jgi:hypothetical protein
VITTEDRAVVQTAPTASQGTHVLTELERLLGEPGCPACCYVAEVERSFFSWFQIESFSSPQVHAQLRAGMGMCPRHSRRLVDQIGEGHIMTTVMREALAGALQHVRGEARAGVCPACEATAAGAQRARHLVLEGLADPAMVRLYCEQGGLCLVHVLQALPAAESAALRVLAERLLANLREPSDRGSLAILAGADDDAGSRARWRDRLPELAIGDSTFDRLGELIEIGACPVCLSSGVAESDYLRWFLARSAEDDDSLRSDPGEFCPVHLHDAALADGSSAACFAIDHKSAVRIAHLERLLGRLSQLPLPARRGKRSQTDALDQVRGEVLAPPFCAACHARAGIERSSMALIVASLSVVPMRERYERCHGLCVLHAMEMPNGHAARVARRHLDGQLGVLAWEVGEVARKYAWAFRHEASGPEHDAWVRALGQIDGRVFAGAPTPAGDPTQSQEAQ